jgi:hypothetical protein
MPTSPDQGAVIIAEPLVPAKAHNAGTSTLQAELQQLKLPELCQRAAAAGISEAAVEKARDGDEPKKDVIELIVAATAAAVAQAASVAQVAARQAASQRALTAELQQLKLPDLRARAAAAGVGNDKIEEARDADEPKQEIIALILATQVGP